jgi:uncharacterized DUF497 family protein
MRRIGFEWDEVNDTKSYTKHGVSTEEGESVFQDEHRLDFPDPTHSVRENRYVTIGRSAHPRVMFVAWRLRGRLVRVISVRPASKQERAVYEGKNKKRKG